MSLTTGLIALKGQYTDKLSEVFDFFKLIDTTNDAVINSWEEVSGIIDEEYMNPNDNLQKRVIWADNGWTIIEDLSLLLCTDEEALLKISQHFSTPVFSLATQGTGSSYGFWYYDKQKVRSFFNNNGEIADNFGTPLTQEANLNLNENAFYDDIHGVAKQFGIDWTRAENINYFIVKRLENSEELNNEIEEAVKQSNLQKADNNNSKPWWKFW